MAGAQPGHPRRDGPTALRDRHHRGIPGPSLDVLHCAIYVFAAAVATDAAGIEQADVDRLRVVGLSDADIADVIFAAAARCFFTAVLDGAGAQLDAETAAAFPPDQIDGMVVGRPVAGT